MLATCLNIMFGLTVVCSAGVYLKTKGHGGLGFRFAISVQERCLFSLAFLIFHYSQATRGAQSSGID